MTNQHNKMKELAKPEWAMKFFARKIKKYWPEAQKLLSVKIDPLRVFLDYQRFSCRYYFIFLNSRGKKEKKSVVLKAQKIKKGVLWPPRLGEIRKEYLTPKFLVREKLGKISPQPLGFYPQIPAYVYEEVPGFVLKHLLLKGQKLKTKEFLSYIPAVVLTIKKVHSVKKRPPYATLKIKEKMTRQLTNSFNLIKKYYSAGYPRFKKMIQILKRFRKQYQYYLFDEQNYTLTHGDFQIDNILVNKNKKIILLDWADSDFFNPLDDLGSFFAQTELHLKYILPQKYQPFFEKIKKTFIKNYFSNSFKPIHQLQIDYFSTKDFLRIITFISFTQKGWQPKEYIKMMESLLKFAEGKIKNLEENYL